MTAADGSALLLDNLQAASTRYFAGNVVQAYVPHIAELVQKHREGQEITLRRNCRLPLDRRNVPSRIPDIPNNRIAPTAAIESRFAKGTPEARSASVQ